MSPIRLLSLSALACGVALSGCGGGGGGGSGASAGGGSGGGGVTAPASVQGQVVKGITRHALITAYVPDGSGGFVMAGTPTLSNADGSFSLPLGNYTGVLKIVATNSNDPAKPTMMQCDASPATGCGAYPSANVEDVNGNGLVDTGEWGPVAADFELRGVASMVGGGIHFLNLTPLSTLAADWAEQFPQGLDAASATAANTQVAVTFGFATSAELNEPIGDITDIGWTNLATPEQLKLPLMLAAFQEAAQYFSFDAQAVVDAFSDAYTGNEGRLLEDSAVLEPTLAHLFRIERAIVGTIDVPSVPQAQIEASLDAALATLQTGELTLVAPTTAQGFLDKLGYLGDDIQQVLEITGLDDPQAFVTAQRQHYDWIGAPANDGMLTVAFKTALYSLVGAYDLSRTPAEGQQYVVFAPEPSAIVLDIPNKRLLITGQHSGQTVDLAVDLTSMREGVTNHRFAFGIQGTVENDEAKGFIDGTLVVDTGTTDLSALLEGLPDAPKTDSSADYGDLSTQLTNLLQTGNGTIELNGSARLESKLFPGKVLGGRVNLTGALNLAAAPGQQIAALDVLDADLVLPDGSHFYKLPTDPVLHLVVGDDAELKVVGGATLFGLPQALLQAQGKMKHSRELVLHFRDVVCRHMNDFFLQLLTLNASAQAMDSFSADLRDFDYSQVVLSGSGHIDIPTLTSAAGGSQQYRARVSGPLNDLTIDVYQPHSNDIAVTMNLDPAAQRVRMLIGTEPWVLRALTTPTPRLVMLGPDGQYSEWSQEDLYAFIEGLPFSDVVTGFGVNTAP